MLHIPSSPNNEELTRNVCRVTTWAWKTPCVRLDLIEPSDNAARQYFRPSWLARHKFDLVLVCSPGMEKEKMGKLWHCN